MTGMNCSSNQNKNSKHASGTYTHMVLMQLKSGHAFFWHDECIALGYEEGVVPEWATAALQRMQKIVVLTTDLIKKMFDLQTIDSFFECFDVFQYLVCTPRRRLQLLTLYDRLLVAREQPAGRAEFITVLDTGILSHKRARVRGDPAVNKNEYNQDLWRISLESCLIHGHSLPTLESNLSFYMAFKRNTNPGERDIRVLKEQHGNSTRQSLRDTIVVVRHAPFDNVSQLVSRTSGQIVPCQIVWEWMQLWKSLFGERHNAATKRRKDVGNTRAKQEGTCGRLALRNKVSTALDNLCTGTVGSSDDTTLFGGTATLRQFQKSHEDIRFQFSERFKDIYKKYSAYRAKRCLEDHVQKSARYKLAQPAVAQPKAGPKRKSAAQRLRIAALNTVAQFDPRREGSVFISQAAANTKELRGLKLVAPFEKVLRMSTAAIVIVPSLDVGSNLRSENQSSLDLDPFVLNCILHGRRLATPQYLSALLQPSRKLDEFPPSIKYSCLLALVAAKLFCTATYRAEHNAQFKMLLKASTLSVSKWQIIDDHDEFVALKKLHDDGAARLLSRLKTPSQSGSTGRSAKCKAGATKATGSRKKAVGTTVPCIHINSPIDLYRFVRSVSVVDRSRSTKGRFQPVIRPCQDSSATASTEPQSR